MEPCPVCGKLVPAYTSTYGIRVYPCECAGDTIWMFNSQFFKEEEKMSNIVLGTGTTPRPKVTEVNFHLEVDPDGGSNDVDIFANVNGEEQRIGFFTVENGKILLYLDMVAGKAKDVFHLYKNGEVYETGRISGSILLK